MAKKKMGRPKKSERDDVTAKLDRVVVSQAKLVAGAKAIPLAEYLSDLLRPLVAKDLSRRMKELDGPQA